MCQKQREVWSLGKASDQEHLYQPQPTGNLREIEAAFGNQRIDHSVKNRDHDYNQDGVHGLQGKQRGHQRCHKDPLGLQKKLGSFLLPASDPAGFQ